MKKLCKVILIFLAVVILLIALAAGALMIFKPDLVRAVYDGLMLNSEQLEEKKKENEKQLVNTINDFGFNISQEDLEKLESGELSEEDIKGILLENQNPENKDNIGETDNSVLDNSSEESPHKTDKPSTPDKPSDDTKPSSSDKTPDASQQDEQEPVYSKNEPTTTVTDNTTVQKPDKEETTSPTNALTSEQIKAYEEKTAELVAKMYALKSQYLGQINGIVASMKAEYAALPKEQRTTSAKTSIANSYLGQISALEAQCDAQVNSVVSQLREVLAKSGKDTSLADSIIAAYNTEKETTKAAYINQYSD